VGLLLTLSSCVVGRSTADPLPPSPGQVRVALSEFRFDLAPPTVPGRHVFQAENRGTIDHSLTLIALPDDFPPLDEQLRGDTRRGATTLASLRRRPPGAKGIFAVDLLPGRYGLVCFVPDEAGVSHAVKGMNAEFRVS
jgi:hypothetical protein